MARYSNSVSQILDGNGDVIVGAKKFMFEVGTTTKKTVYTDSALTTAQTNPVISDSDGRFPDIFLNGLYKEEQQDNSGTATGYDGVTLWTRDPVGEVVEGPLLLWETDTTYNIPDLVLGSNDKYYRALADSNTGNNPTSSPGSWEQLQFGRIWNVNVTYGLGDSIYGSDGFLYISIIASNLGGDPVSTAASWRPAMAQGQSAVATGAVDVITATFSPAIAALNNTLEVRLRALGANVTTTPTFAPNGLDAKTIVKNGNTALSAGDIAGSDHEIILKYNSTNDNWELLNPANVFLIGEVVQIVDTQIGTIATGGTLTPYDDTIPQKTEGDQYFALSITPKYATSILHFAFVGHVASAVVGSRVAVALFKGSEVDASAVGTDYFAVVDQIQPMVLKHRQVAGSITATTYTIRIGVNSGVVTLNGFNAVTRRYGGLLISGLTITEVRA